MQSNAKQSKAKQAKQIESFIESMIHLHLLRFSFESKALKDIDIRVLCAVSMHRKQGKQNRTTRASKTMSTEVDYFVLWCCFLVSIC